MSYDPDPHTFEGIWYRWTCSNCDSTHETEDDIRGSEQECPDCGATARVEGN